MSRSTSEIVRPISVSTPSVFSTEPADADDTAAGSGALISGLALAVPCEKLLS